MDQAEADSRREEASRWVRSRVILAVIAGFVVVLGLSTRRFPSAFPDIVARYGGDALWAVLVFCLCAFIAPAARSSVHAAVALCISFGVELSKLLQWDWLIALRGTRFGALVLGYGFLWSDLASYTVGVLGAFAVDRAARRMRGRRPVATFEGQGRSTTSAASPIMYFDTPIAAVIAGFPPRAIRVLAVREHGEDAYVLVDARPDGPAYLYGVNCRREAAGWVEGLSANGEGWSLTDDQRDLGTVVTWDEAPTGATRVRLEFAGLTREEPIENGVFLSAWWRVPCPDGDRPRVRAFFTDGEWCSGVRDE